MSRPKSDIQRQPLPMRIKVHIMQYVRVKASVLGMSSNILIEDALIKLLKKTRNMSKLDAYRLIRSPVKMRRIPITTTIQDRVLSEARELAKKLDVLFAEVVEVAIAETKENCLEFWSWR